MLLLALILEIKLYLSTNKQAYGHFSEKIIRFALTVATKNILLYKYTSYYVDFSFSCYSSRIKNAEVYFSRNLS